MKKHILPKFITLFIIYGTVYLLVEVIFRAITFQCKILYPNYFSLYGSVSLWMFPVGALCGVFLGLIDELKLTIQMYSLVKTLFGALIILIVEFGSGLIFNKILNLNIWDYSSLPFNICGQICILFGFLWMLLVPFAFWFGNFVQWCLYDEIVEIKSLWQTYKDTFLFWFKK
jgi:uncharacterized membrane protein